MYIYIPGVSLYAFKHLIGEFHHPPILVSITVHRDKAGQRIDPKLERLKKREEERKKEEKELQNLKWGRG